MTIDHRESTFRGRHGDDIFWQSWVPDDVRARVVLCHGVHEHSGRYAHVAEHLAVHGIASYALDHHGHGCSGGAGGDLGSLDGALSDIHQLRELAEAEGAEPLFVLGHSMGGMLATAYVIRYGGAGLAGLAVSGPAIDTSSVDRIQLAIAPLLGRLLPQLGLVQLDADQVSRDPAVVADYLADPLVRSGKMRARTGAEILRGVTLVHREADTITLPVLALHGADDALVPADASRQLTAKVGSSDVTLSIYPELFHEIFNEPEQDQVLGELTDWLLAHL